MESNRFQSGTVTDVGRQREHNEDTFLVDEDISLFLVADGMGGQAAGEVASSLAATTFRDFLRDHQHSLELGAPHEAGVEEILGLLQRAMLAACADVYEAAQSDRERSGMGTTCSALLLLGRRGFVAHVGDSRVYLLRGGRIVQLTRDHSVLNELIQTGEISPTEAGGRSFRQFRHTLSRAVGVCPEVEADTMDFEILPGDRLVLCSDGLTRHVKDEELKRHVESPPQAMAEELVELANSRGGADNITVVVLHIDAVAEDNTDELNEIFRAKLAAFRTVGLFSDLPMLGLLRFLSITTSQEYQRGEVILREGEEGDSLFVVLSGEVLLESHGTEVARVSAGEHFGELALLDHAPRSATATMSEPGRLLSLDRASFHKLVAREPELAVKVLWNVSRVFAARLRSTTARLTDTNG